MPALSAQNCRPTPSHPGLVYFADEKPAGSTGGAAGTRLQKKGPHFFWGTGGQSALGSDFQKLNAVLRPNHKMIMPSHP
jgi:hypothetical protein